MDSIKSTVARWKQEHAWFRLIADTISEWQEDQVSRLAAALAYYTVFAIAPLLLLLFAMLSYATDANSIRGNIYNRIAEATSTQTADAIQSMVENVNTGSGTLSTIVAVVLLIWTSATLFIHLQRSLNTVWEVRQKADLGISYKVRQRALALILIPLVGMLLLVSLLASTGLSAIGGVINNASFLPGGTSAVLLQILTLVLTFLVVTLLFGLIYKVLPDVIISWNDVLVGSTVSAALFVLGQLLLAIYLGRQSNSAYGAAGALLVFLLWLYYSAQILFLGAEFTQVYAREQGKEIQPDENAFRMRLVDQLEEGVDDEQVKRAAQREQARGATPR